MPLPVDLGKRFRALDFQPYDSLGQNLHLTLDGRTCLLVPLVCREIHIAEELIDQLYALQDIAKMPFAVPKRQEQPPVGPGSFPILSTIRARTDLLWFPAGRRGDSPAFP